MYAEGIFSESLFKLTPTLAKAGMQLIVGMVSTDIARERRHSEPGFNGVSDADNHYGQQAGVECRDLS